MPPSLKKYITHKPDEMANPQLELALRKCLRRLILKVYLDLIKQDHKVIVLYKHIKIVADMNIFFGAIKKYINQWHSIQSSSQVRMNLELNCHWKNWQDSFIS